MKSLRVVLSAAALVAVVAPVMHAQITIQPMVGGYMPGNSMNQVSGAAAGLAESRDGTLSLGLNINLGPIRGSFAYASGTTIKNASKQDVGKGNVLAAAADLTIRPIPRIFVQPYLIAGAGEKFYKYDQSPTFTTTGADREFALHGGIGADVMVGPVGVVAEWTDFVSKGADKKWNVHDSFLMMGLRLPLL